MSENKKFNPAYVGMRPDIMELIPKSTGSVLDVGCSNGRVGAEIKLAFGARVTGIETSAEMALVAAKHLDHVIVGDVEMPTIQHQLEGKTFDAIICADVLEHLRDPWVALEHLRSHIRLGGVLIASIPNIRHIDTLFNLAVRGKWPYRDRGIHDRTHLRFFTRSNIVDLFTGAGYNIVEIKSNYRLIERPHSANRYTKYFLLPGIKEFLTFQYLIKAVPKE